MKHPGCITNVPGLVAGHAQDERALTGCTVVLCSRGAVAGVDQRGSAPGTRETDLLNPIHRVQRIHAILLAGGSAFGLDAASGVMQYLKERGIGHSVGRLRIPIVPAAILYDLGIGSSEIYPDAAMGYAACVAASRTPLHQGNAGAGIGASAGKLLGMASATKTGIGSASLRLAHGVVIAALVAVNPFGDVVDSNHGQILAGLRVSRRGPLRVGQGPVWANTESVMQSALGRSVLALASTGTNTVIGVVATNASLTKPQATKVAQMAQAGLVRSIRPANTMFDGDTLFALSTGKRKADINLVGSVAAQVVELAIQNAVSQASSAGGLPAAIDLSG